MAGLVVAAAILALWGLNASVPALLTRVRGSGSATSRQRQTAAGLLASGLRYVIVVAALVAIFVSLAGGGTLGAVSGAALVLVVVSFASQRLLGDVIAGFFVLLEAYRSYASLRVRRSSNLRVAKRPQFWPLRWR